jgi:hypothetical protein
MSALPIRRGRLALGTARLAGYFVTATALGLIGWFLAAVPNSALVPATAVIAFAGALSCGLVGLRRGALASPLVLLGVPLLLSLAAAMQPVTRIFGEWSPSNLVVAALIVAAPLAGVGTAILASPGRTPPMQRGTDAAPYPARLVAICVLMFSVSTLVYVIEWSSVGGPPLLSATIDKTRFAVQVGLLHVFTQGLPLALLIATWARIGRRDSFTPLQRRALEWIMVLSPIVLALGGGRALVLVPLLAALAVGGRYVSRRTARRLLIVLPVAIIVFSSVVFVARIGQNSPTGAVGTVLYNESGAKTSALDSSYKSLSIGLGQQLRVVAELRDAHVELPPFTTSIWFAHNFVDRAVDPQTITGPNAGGWLTATYAGPLMLDLGLSIALLFGFLLGAVAHLIYRRFARGRSVTTIWLYAYLSGPIAFCFYVNVFTQFIFPVLDLVALFVLSRWLVAPEKPVAG